MVNDIEVLKNRITRLKALKIEYELSIDDLEKEIKASELKLKGGNAMKFCQALEAMKQGYKVKMPNWSGYWCIENGSIMMYTKDGRALKITETDDIFYTINFVLQDGWVIADEDNCPVLNDELVSTFSFGEAIRYLKNGNKVARNGWNGKGMFVVYQKGYPEGIHCNKQTAIAWGINVVDLFKCEPYLQIKMVNGSHSMWVPSINDVLSEDWQIAK